MFYPSSCLGGWTNVTKATGKPDVIGEKGFSNLNSAILPENTSADLFCGGFTGEIPPNKDPKVLILRVAWSQTGSTSTPEVIEGESFASSTGVILYASTSPDFISTEGTTTATTTPVQDATTSEVAPKIEQPVKQIREKATTTESTSSPQTRTWLPTLIAFLKVFTQNVYAEDTTTLPTEPTVSTAPSATTETATQTNTTTSTQSLPIDITSTSVATGTQHDVPIDTPAPQKKEVPVDPLVAPVDTPVVATHGTSTDVATSSMSGLATTTEATSTAKYPPFFEIEYTLDGVIWTTLGGVALKELQATQFEIPIPENATWDDLSKLQIHVKRVSNVDVSPTIFLDGMTLEIETQDFTGKRRNQKIVDIVNNTPQVFVKDVDQGDDVSLFVMSSSTHGVALYNASGTLLYTTQAKENENFYSVHDLDYGSYTFVLTDDKDWCAGKTYEECTATSTNVFKGTITFKVTRPLY